MMMTMKHLERTEELKLRFMLLLYARFLLIDRIMYKQIYVCWWQILVLNPDVGMSPATAQFVKRNTATTTTTKLKTPVVVVNSHHTGTHPS
jgi:hypothetical protein